MITNLDPSGFTRQISEARIREASHLRELRRREPATTPRTATKTSQRHTRLWNLVHFRQAYS
jgi:hypothetical protein